MDDVEAIRGTSSQGSILDARVAFRESYLSRLLPVLVNIHEQGSGLTICDRLRAVKFAADMSLVLTADGVCWSRALGKQLTQQLEKGANHFNSTVLDGGQQLHASSQGNAAGKQSDCNHLEIPEKGMLGNIAMNRPARRSGLTVSHLHHGKKMQKRISFRRFCKRKPLAKRHGKLIWKRTYMKALHRYLPHGGRQRKAVSRVMTDESAGDGKIRILRKMIPGGDDMDAAILLEQAADYIVSLQMQVEALQSLAEAAMTTECV